jgi:hypothetical protein
MPRLFERPACRHNHSFVGHIESGVGRRSTLTLSDFTPDCNPGESQEMSSPDLLRTETVARRGASLRRQLEAIFAKLGSFYPWRDNFRLTPAVMAKFTEKLRADPGEFSGSKVAWIVRSDGLKFALPTVPGFVAHTRAPSR